MRFTAIETIYEAAQKDDRIVFITGDLGHAKTKEFQENLPGRYFNGGMAEQNIIGMAAGMALSGMKVFVYSITPFITLRAIEQIKVDVCHQNLDVTVVGVGSGLAYGSAGVTHHSIEEIAALRAMPNMKIVSPADPEIAKLLTAEIIKEGGPAYLRLGRGQEETLNLDYKPKLGRAEVIREGDEVTLIASGTIVKEAVKASEILKKEGINAEVLDMHTIKPLDVGAIKERAKSRKAIFTIEDHNIIGGLGGAVAEVLSELPEKPLFKRFGVGDEWLEAVGSEDYLRETYGFSAEKVAKEVKKCLT